MGEQMGKWLSQFKKRFEASLTALMEYLTKNQRQHQGVEPLVGSPPEQKPAEQQEPTTTEPHASRGYSEQEAAEVIRANELTERQVQPLLTRQPKTQQEHADSLVEQYFTKINAMTPAERENFFRKQTMADIWQIMKTLTQEQRETFVQRTQELAQVPSFGGSSQGLSPQQMGQLHAANELTARQVAPLLTRETVPLSARRAILNSQGGPSPERLAEAQQFREGGLTNNRQQGRTRDAGTQDRTMQATP
jgi:1,2-phenylacetyl-CoA epoxidase PaaB subunit